MSAASISEDIEKFLKAERQKPNIYIEMDKVVLFADGRVGDDEHNGRLVRLQRMLGAFAGVLMAESSFDAASSRMANLVSIHDHEGSMTFTFRKVCKMCFDSASKCFYYAGEPTTDVYLVISDKPQISSYEKESYDFQHFPRGKFIEYV